MALALPLGTCERERIRAHSLDDELGRIGIGLGERGRAGGCRRRCESEESDCQEHRCHRQRVSVAADVGWHGSLA